MQSSLQDCTHDLNKKLKKLSFACLVTKSMVINNLLK